jgi:hypothetical protein
MIDLLTNFAEERLLSKRLIALFPPLSRPLHLATFHFLTGMFTLLGVVKASRFHLVMQTTISTAIE